MRVVAVFVVVSVVAVAVLCHVVVGSFDEVGFVVSIVVGCCPFRSCCLGGGSCAFLEFRSSAPSLVITSRVSFSASDAIRTCSFAHVIVVAPCDTHRVPPSTPMTLAVPIQCPCLRLLDPLTCTPVT